MTNQDSQNQIKNHSIGVPVKKDNGLSFVGCENCQLICCDGRRFSRSSVLLNELYDTAQLFPVVFKKDGEKTAMRFIFSLKKGVPCPYLDSKSKKCTVYEKVRPRVCRSYPFRIDIETRQNSKTAYKITALRSCPSIQESAEGLQFMNDEGEISDKIIENFIGREDLANHEKNLRATNKFLDMVNELDLLVDAEIVLGKNSSPEGGFKEEFLHILMVSEQKLAALDLESKMRLKTSGYIIAINIHRKSLFHFKKFIQAMNEFL